MKLKLVLLFLILFLVKISSQEVVTIDPNAKYQKIKGWGVSLAWWANIMGSWSDTKINDVTWHATAPEALNMNVFRFNIGGGDHPSHNHMRSDGGAMPGYRSWQADNQGWGTYNLNNDWRQIKVMKAMVNQRKARGKSDYITELFSCSPPYWMTKSGCSAGSGDGSDNVHPNYYDDFADYLATVAKALKSSYSWNVQYLEPFNEPVSNFWKSGGNQEGCYVYPSIQAQVLWNL